MRICVFLSFMVYCFSYKHKQNIHRFLWDAESGSLHNVDSDAFLVAKNRYGNLDEQEQLDLNQLDKQLVNEITAELLALEAEGVLNSPDTLEKQVKPIDEVKALCLHICHDCNLRCQYCFASDGTYKGAREYMSFEVGRAAIDFLIKNSGKRHNLEVDFFGGEPLMNLETVKKIVEYARGREKESGKTFSFTLTTNCVLLNDDTARWLDANMSNVVLSIDGRREVNNAVRKTVNGKDAFDTILANALNASKIRGDKNHYVRGTFTAKNLDFVKDIMFLREAGFKQISMEPVVTDIEELAITEEMLPTILREYEKLAEYYLDCRNNADSWFNFFHFMLDLEGGPCLKKRITGCGSGCEYLSVVPRGDIYPCHQFADNNKYLMGNVLNDDFSREISKPFAENTVTQKAACKDCFAKYYCSGGCAANNFNFEGDINKPYSISCEMMKKRFELSLAISAIEECK